MYIPQNCSSVVILAKSFKIIIVVVVVTVVMLFDLYWFLLQNAQLLQTWFIIVYTIIFQNALQNK